MISTLFLCIISISSLSAEATNINNLTLTEKIIRELNLFPKLDVNIVEDDRHPAEAPTLVETRFRFPYLDDNSAGVTVEDLGHHAGYYSLPHTEGARMFYFFFESRNKNASVPVVIWLAGGPGCSGSVALFYENGPFHLTRDSSLVWNAFGWDQVSNLIYVDQPTGTGFSYSTSGDDLRRSSEEAGADLYDFMQAFFEKHPKFAKKHFYVTGESYAGHFIPAFASHIHWMNKNRQGIHIKLKGLAIGNGFTNPEIQYKSLTDYALQMKLINKFQYQILKKSVSKCLNQIRFCAAGNSSSDCSNAIRICNGVFESIVDYRPGTNYYDIRKKCVGSQCYDLSTVETFLNNLAVRNALGVGDIPFVSCSTVVYNYMSLDWMKKFDVGLPLLLQDRIKVLIYAGEYDLVCNWLGNSRWVENLKWSGQKQFVSAQPVEFRVEGVKVGLRKSYGGLSFLKVYDAGHLVPMDQPKASLEMLRRWIQDQSL